MPGFARFGGSSKPVVLIAGVVLALVLAWVVVARVSASLDDRYESFYPSLAEAKKDGAVTRGWVPDDLLPSSSRAIHEVHYLSPSTEWCAFEFNPVDSEQLRKNLKSIDKIPAAIQRVPNPKVSWWPSVLKGNINTEVIQKEKLELYVVERPQTSVTMEIYLFAVDWSNGRGFFYVTGE